MDDKIKKELQSATFERLINHLREKKEVQNIDLMNLAGFCRNCLSKWYREEAKKKGIEISDPDAREHVYGMSSIQSRACAVLAKGKYVFALPGSSGGVADAWDKILKFQLDINYKPCNFVELFPRLKEK